MMKVMRPLRSVGWLGGSGYQIIINVCEKRRAEARARRRRAKVQYHRHEKTADGQRCPTGECNAPLTEV